jgi:transcriptional regulator with XRE-family HTH domain
MNGKDFGTRIDALVKQRCESNQAFARDLGVSLGYALSLMNEPLIVSNPGARLLQRMSRLLGVSVGFLLGESAPADAVVSESHATWRN